MKDIYQAAIKALTPQEYAATTKAKRKGKKAGKQFTKQPKGIAKKLHDLENLVDNAILYQL